MSSRSVQGRGRFEQDVKKVLLNRCLATVFECTLREDEKEAASHASIIIKVPGIQSSDVLTKWTYHSFGVTAVHPPNIRRIEAAFTVVVAPDIASR